MDSVLGIFGLNKNPPVSNERKVIVMGLSGTGKKSFVQQIASRSDFADIVPLDQSITRIRKDSNTMNFRILDGERKRRGEWPHFSTGSKAIVYMVDAANAQRMLEAKNVFHYFLKRPQMAAEPFSVLVLGNKTDLPLAVDESTFVQLIGVDLIQNRDVGFYMVSCRNGDNIELALQWLISHSGV